MREFNSLIGDRSPGAEARTRAIEAELEQIAVEERRITGEPFDYYNPLGF